MFEISSRYYDAIYRAAGKDYAAEAGRVHEIVQASTHGAARRLLDVACGTGGHVEHLKVRYTVEGADLSQEMLSIARHRHPDVTFHQADMTTLDLGTVFDAVICLFSSIGYVKTVETLRQTLRAFARHVVPGGVVVVDGWITPDNWHDGYLHALLVDEPDLKLARLSRNTRDGTLSVMEMHHLAVTVGGADSFIERHEMGLFTPEQYCAAFEQAGLGVTYDAAGGLSGRGVYIGVRPTA